MAEYRVQKRHLDEWTDEWTVQRIRDGLLNVSWWARCRTADHAERIARALTLLEQVEATATRPSEYYTKALGLVADELATLQEPLPPERGLKMAAILRAAAPPTDEVTP